MTRFIVENNITTINDLKSFDYDGYVYDRTNNKNISNIPNQEEEYKWTKLEQIDKILDKQHKTRFSGNNLF